MPQYSCQVYCRTRCQDVNIDDMILLQSTEVHLRSNTGGKYAVYKTGDVRKSLTYGSGAAGLFPTSGLILHRDALHTVDEKPSEIILDGRCIVRSLGTLRSRRRSESKARTRAHRRHKESRSHATLHRAPCLVCCFCVGVTCSGQVGARAVCCESERNGIRLRLKEVGGQCACRALWMWR